MFTVCVWVLPSNVFMFLCYRPCVSPCADTDILINTMEKMLGLHLFGEDWRDNLRYLSKLRNNEKLSLWPKYFYGNFVSLPRLFVYVQVRKGEGEGVEIILL